MDAGFISVDFTECVEISNPERCALYDTVTFDSPSGLMEQVLWPAHCVQNSWGAELHQDLKVRQHQHRPPLSLFLPQVHPKGKVIHKGINPDVDSYSAFFDK